MPKRFLKPGITTSEAWNACDFDTQSFYIRIITLVDDYGRYDGRPPILKAHAFPLNDRVTLPKIEKMSRELVENDLATFYKAGNKTVLQLQRWEERVRSPSKFPAFDSTCEQMYADVRKCTPPPPSPSPTSSPSPLVPAPADAGELGLEIPQNLRTQNFLSTWEKWVPYRKKIKGCKDWVMLFQEQLTWLGTFPEATAIEMINNSIRQGYQGIFELKDKGGKPSGGIKPHIVGSANY